MFDLTKILVPEQLWIEFKGEIVEDEDLATSEPFFKVEINVNTISTINDISLSNQYWKRFSTKKEAENHLQEIADNFQEGE